MRCLRGDVFPWKDQEGANLASGDKESDSSTDGSSPQRNAVKSPTHTSFEQVKILARFSKTVLSYSLQFSDLRDLHLRMSRQQQQHAASKRGGMTLDFNSSPKKRPRVANSGGNGLTPAVLTTPDVQMLKLSSPELAKFLSPSNNQGLPTPTPSTYAFPKTVTEEQALYAKGFEDALHNMHQEQKPATRSASAKNSAAISTIEKATAAHSKGANGANNLLIAANAIADQPPLPVSLPGPAAAVSRPSSGASGSIDSNDSTYVLPEGVTVKTEADDDDSDGSSVAPTYPIDMDSQERIKLERKRARNRLAASKCRKKKLERIANLDEKVQALKGENNELAAVVKRLREAVYGLKQEVMDHMQGGCQIMITDIAGI